MHPHRLIDIEEMGFVFSTAGSEGENLFHEKYFKNHYRYRTEPLIKPQFIKQPQPLRFGSQPGRNEPCPCGSGKRYKHCHGSLV
jgi:uncharacterized protein YecA (UPF0149 family)